MTELIFMQFSPFCCYILPLRPKCFSEYPILENPQHMSRNQRQELPATKRNILLVKADRSVGRPNAWRLCNTRSPSAVSVTWHS